MNIYTYIYIHKYIYIVKKYAPFHHLQSLSVGLGSLTPDSAIDPYQGILSLVNMVALKIELENGSHAIRPFHSSTPIHLMYFCTRYSHIRLLKNKYL